MGIGERNAQPVPSLPGSFKAASDRSQITSGAQCRDRVFAGAPQDALRCSISKRYDQ